MAWVRGPLCKFQKGWTRLAAASDKVVYQLLAQGRWFSPGTPASSAIQLLTLVTRTRQYLMPL
jgi:hypothetical protein